MEATTPINYCLYARKSSESDERQAMSIDSQIKEMSELAKKENLIVKNVYEESHSAKISGERAMFMQLLSNIRNGQYNGILTWAPDRLSRNAGDLGMLVDLMDQGKLVKIRTFSQVFSNNPNEKFLLMILCSQAKLENDQKGINVKRGIRAKCERGWRPGPSPLGYINRSFAGTKDIAIDSDRAPLITKMFGMVAGGASGRDIKKWADKIGFNYKSGKPITLSQVYRMLGDTFYYGEFEYPVGNGNWYKGAHKPLITKELFTKVRELMKVPEKSKWGGKNLIYKGILKCANCKSSVIGEERFRERKYGREPRHHIYYHCSRKKDLDCREPYITEKKLEEGILRFINFIYINHPRKINLTEKIREGMENFRKLREEILLQQDINPNSQVWDIRDYAKHVLSNGDSKMKRELFNLFDYQFYLQNRQVTTLRAH
ncbi:recombinase family protein [Candidatus Microgenomates bacterium]|nr:recombinase family protein [Candidatus Microgenomates bacterium]